MHKIINALLPTGATRAQRGRAGLGGQPLVFDATAHPSLSSVSWRHYVHETLKTDTKNEAASLLKTKGRNVKFPDGEAVSLLKKGG